MHEDAKDSAQAARGALVYLGWWALRYPSSAAYAPDYDGTLFFCYQMVADHYDTTKGRTTTWDAAIHLWGERQRVTGDQLTPWMLSYYKGRSQLGRFACMRHQPSTAFVHGVRDAFNTFYETIPVDKALGVRVRVPELTEGEQQTLDAAREAFTDLILDRQQRVPALKDDRLPKDALYFRGLALWHLRGAAVRQHGVEYRNQARDDLLAYLQADPSGAYAQEATELLERIKKEQADGS